jgi:hypothetical protein
VLPLDTRDEELLGEPEEGDELAGDEPALADVVAELIDAADPEVADVMARLIDTSDPDLVAQLVDSDDLSVAEVVAQLLDAADPDVASMVSKLVEVPERREVAAVLQLVDKAYGADEGGEVPPDVKAKLEELDIEADLRLTSRPREMGAFAHLDNDERLRVIIRVLCGLVGRDDLPRPRPSTPRQPASPAEERRWPLSRARWPLPLPVDETLPPPAAPPPLPARRTSTKAS